MTQQHKHSDILRAIADGERLQRTYDGGGPLTWMPIDHEGALTMIASGMGDWLRIKPATVTVNGIECPVQNNHGAGIVKLTIHLVGNIRMRLLSFDTDEDALKVYAAIIKPFEVQG